MLSGGSEVSWSATFAAKIVTLHDSPSAKSVSGSSVNVVGPPETAAVWVPLDAQEIENHEPETFTGSLKVTVIFASAATPPAPFDGEVEATAGAVSVGQGWMVETVFRGDGAPAVKSLPLLSVSTQPAAFRSAEVVFESVAAGEPSKKFAPS